ncbi:MAG: hypothetical protein RRA45_09050 [Saccharolobus sp.]|jgi:hypothetical protein|uniref:hypothetical protein n=1 Tax=Saccharolobus sp. TaxID=2100761 RepID=UPI0028CD2FE3|nr:hypothetical protein [Saccharolobus sp.]MDT7862345.1 hypothetical protein [Saccharolobus sp.]
MFENFFNISLNNEEVSILVKQRSLICIGVYVKSGEWDSYWELSELIKKPVSRDAPNCQYFESGEIFKVLAKDVISLVKEHNLIDIWRGQVAISITPKRNFIFLIKIYVKNGIFEKYDIFHEDLTLQS